MDTIQSVILGIIQSITEFLPISSTAHLVIIPWLFSWQDDGLPFNVALHIGSLIAIIAYFRDEWILVIKDFCKGLLKTSFKDNPQGKVGLFLLIGTIPAVISGLTFESYASGILRKPIFIAISLSLFGIFLFMADKHSKNTKKMHDIDFIDCLYFGIAQAFAIIPGVSRSGVTITGGLLRNFKRDEAAKFSFLLAAPLIFCAAVLQSRHLEMSTVLSTPFITGIVSSAITAFIVIKLLLSFLRKQSYTVFVIYRLLLAAFIALIYLIK